MKTINVTFEDEEFDMLREIKKEASWREFILTFITPKQQTRGGQK